MEVFRKARQLVGILRRPRDKVDNTTAADEFSDIPGSVFAGVVEQVVVDQVGEGLADPRLAGCLQGLDIAFDTVRLLGSMALEFECLGEALKPLRRMIAL